MKFEFRRLAFSFIPVLVLFSTAIPESSAAQKYGWPVGMNKLLGRGFTCSAMEDLYSNISGTLVERDYTKFLTRESCRNKIIIDSFKQKSVSFCPGLKPQRFSRCFYSIFRSVESQKRISVEGVNQLHIAAIEYILRNRGKMSTDRTMLDILIISLRGLERRLRPDHLVMAGRPLDRTNIGQLERIRQKDLHNAWRSAVRMLEQVDVISRVAVALDALCGPGHRCCCARSVVNVTRLPASAHLDPV